MQFHPWLVGMRQAMELMLTGDAIDGIGAARIGFANRAFPAESLEAEVTAIASRVAKIPTDLQQLNKRSIHRGMEIMGMRAALRAGTEIQAMGFHTKSARDYLRTFAEGVTQALDKRDAEFGDYRTKKSE
jgi:enoyl-CoA hydratase